MALFGSKSSAPAGTPSAADSDEVIALRGEAEALRRSQAIIEFRPDGTILWANENFLNAMGYTLEEIRGRHHRLFVDPEEACSHAYQSFWERLGRGEYNAGEFKRFAKGGVEVWIQASYNPVFDDTGRLTKVVKYAADITGRKQEQAELECKVDAISRSQAVIEFDLEGTIANANANFLATVGYTLDEIRGKHHRIFVDPDYAKSAEYAQFWKDLGAGAYQAGQYRRFGKGGREVWIQAAYNPILGPSGKPMKVVKIATDITDQVQTKNKAAEVGGELATSVTEMVSTIEEIAGNVSRTATLAQDAASIANRSSTQVSSLGESSRKIGEVVGVIQDLADQTNLLALNATIEAARAGESGRSFAVVANEVKELANATAEATQNIELSIKEIQDSIDQVVESTQQISMSVGEVSTNTITVAAAIEEQSATMTSLSETADSLQALTVGNAGKPG